MSADLNTVLPEIVLAIYAMLGLVGAAYTGKDRVASMLLWATAAIMLALALWIGVNGSGSQMAFGGMYVDDAFSRFAKVVILVAAAAVLLMSEGYMTARGLLRFEYPMLLQVGLAYLTGAGSKQDLDKAFACFNHLVRQDYSPAFFYMGKCLEQGWGVEQDEAGAAEIWRQGSKVGDQTSAAALKEAGKH